MFWTLYIHFPESQSRMSAKINYWPSKKDFKYVKNKIKIKRSRVRLSTICRVTPQEIAKVRKLNPQISRKARWISRNVSKISFTAVTSRAETIGKHI